MQHAPQIQYMHRKSWKYIMKIMSVYPHHPHPNSHKTPSLVKFNFFRFILFHHIRITALNPSKKSTFGIWHHGFLHRVSCYDLLEQRDASWGHALETSGTPLAAAKGQVCDRGVKKFHLDPSTAKKLCWNPWRVLSMASCKCPFGIHLGWKFPP